MPKIKVSLSTNKIGSHCETIVDFDDEEWAEMDQNDREDYVREVFWDNTFSMLGDWDWEEV